MPFDDDNRDLPKPPPDPLDAWPAFAESVRQRLEAGRAAYGDKSFGKDPATLLTEVQAELLDVCGWSFVLFQRLEAVRASLRAQVIEPQGVATLGAVSKCALDETRSVQHDVELFARC